jgi:hypothetical protein
MFLYRYSMCNQVQEKLSCCGYNHVTHRARFLLHFIASTNCHYMENEMHDWYGYNLNYLSYWLNHERVYIDSPMLGKWSAAAAHNTIIEPDDCLTWVQVQFFSHNMSFIPVPSWRISDSRYPDTQWLLGKPHQHEWNTHSRGHYSPHTISQAEIIGMLSKVRKYIKSS